MPKTIFIVITLIHGLIHFMGFARAFGYINIAQLTKEITKPMGILWFLTGVLFIISVTLFLFRKGGWAYFTLFAVVVSQILILNNWDDAKFGSIINILVLVVAIIVVFTEKFRDEYKNEVKIGLEQRKNTPDTNLTEAAISHLPEVVKKYIRYTGCVGKPTVQNFKINFSGKIRDHKKPVWMPLASEQYNFMIVPTRLFFLNATMKGLPVAGFHCFKNGKASMDIRLLSIFKVEYQAGDKMDISETVTFFNDMCVMAPATLIDERIVWLEVVGNKVKASFSNHGIAISAWLHFNEKGELINFVSEDRYATENDGAIVKHKWSTPLRDYKVINGYKLASYAEAIYTYPEGDFTYATFTLKDISYNLSK